MPEDTKVSKAQQKAVNKYVKNNYDRINVTFPKGQKEKLKEHAQKHDESVNAFIVRSVLETMERDNQSPADSPKAIPSEPASMRSTPASQEEEPFPSPLVSDHSHAETGSSVRVHEQPPAPERPKADTVGKYTERLEQLRKETLSAMNGQGQRSRTGTVSRSGGRNADSLPPLNRESLDAKLERLHREHSQKSE